MAKISWLGANGITLNPGIYGCSPVGAACDHCYAARMARRLVANTATEYHYAAGLAYVKQRDRGIVSADGWTGHVIVDPISVAVERIRRVPRLREPGRRKVFVTSMSDFLHESIPLAWIAECTEAMRKREDIDWLILTKRIDRLPELAERVTVFGTKWPSNVWLGVTIWDQPSADRLIPPLLQVPARVRWVSAEPLLGPVDLTEIDTEGAGYHDALTGRGAVDGRGHYSSEERLSWLIVGGENGPGARPTHPEWVKSLRDQAVAAGVPFHFKGWGSVGVDPANRGGRVLDGRTWDEFPGVQP